MPPRTTQLERRIDRLESRALIAELCTEYGIACDLRDTTTLAALFTPDVVIRAANGSMDARGVDAAVEMFDAMFRVRGPAYHWTHDRIVRFDDDHPDRASGVVLSHAETTPNGRASIAGLRYDDVYRRIDGRWHFAERVLTFVYYMPVAEYAGRLKTVERVLVGSTWCAADLPEATETWRAWHEEHLPRTTEPGQDRP